MKVLKFPSRSNMPLPQEWQTAEVRRMLDAAADSLSSGEVTGWDVGMTETRDPQLYLLGPAPTYDCVLCVSRIGRRYILEDGEGRIVFEHDAMDILVDKVRGTLRRKKAALVSRAALAWVTLRETFEDRVEPVMGEPLEMFTHIAPQLAALV